MPTTVSPAGGVRIAYDTVGSGPVVVLLHGSVLSRAIWRSYGYVDALNGSRTVVRIDLRGHGRSGAPHDPAAYTQDSLLDDVLAVLDAEGIARAAIVGYSLGARVALTAALTAPDRVERIVCLGGSAAEQRGALDAVFFPGVIDSLRTGGMEEFCTRQGLGPEAEGRRNRGTRTAFLAADPDAMAALFSATDSTPAVPESELGQCRVPALWMTGDLDQPRWEESRHAAAIMPEGRFVSLPGRTHGATLGPAEPVLAEVMPFLGAEERDRQQSSGGAERSGREPSPRGKQGPGCETWPNRAGAD